MKNSIYFIGFFLLITCCTNKHKENIERINNSSSIPELLEVAYELRNNNKLFYQVCDILNDSIINRNNSFFIRTIIDIDYENEKISWRFEDCENDIPHFTDNFSFEIYIKNIDSIFIKEKLSNVKNIQKVTKDFVSRPDSICKCYKKVFIDFFGNVKLPKGGPLLSINVKNKEGLTKHEWKLFFECMFELISFYENKRNDITLQKWNVEYNSLNLDKKIAVLKMTNLVLFIKFNKEY